MSSPISLSNFNGIDFSVILNAVMTQASQPLTALQSQNSDLATESNNYNTLATKLGSLETAAAGLSTSSAVTAYAATASDTTALAVNQTGDQIAGTYDVVVQNLAQTQVTASTSTAGDADTTTVATGGKLTIKGVDVTLSGAVTLQGLASAINGTTGISVKASVVQTASAEYRLVLTSADTGLANAFTVTNTLTGGTGVTFGANAQEAVDATVTVNHLTIKSASNTLTSGIPGTALSLLHADPTKTVTVTVGPDDSALVTSVKSFVSAYNDLMTFISDQSKAAANGDTGTLAHEALVRQARSALRTALGGSYGSGTFTHLAEIGVGFNQTGQLTLTPSMLTTALSQDRASVVKLFAGTATTGGFTNGAFGTLQAGLDEFTRSGGFISAAQTQLLAQEARLNAQISNMQDRLAVQRAALQAEYTAADQAMATLKAQSASLSGTSSSQSSNSLVTNG